MNVRSTVGTYTVAAGPVIQFKSRKAVGSLRPSRLAGLLLRHMPKDNIPRHVLSHAHIAVSPSYSYYQFAQLKGSDDADRSGV